MDFAGINAYFPLSDAQNPGQEELNDGWIDFTGKFDGADEQHNSRCGGPGSCGQRFPSAGSHAV